jgi:serine/threonine protein kinase
MNEESDSEETEIATESTRAPKRAPNDSAGRRGVDLAGTTIDDRYVVEREFDHGGIGVVYLARDKRVNNRHVVIKVLLEEALRDAHTLAKFQHEKEALSRIDEHPGIVSILDAGNLPSGHPYLVMQYIRGGSFRRLIQRGGMDIRLAGQLISEVCDAVAAAHEHGIYHRDLKPENLMIQQLPGGRQQVKVIDFGIAKVRNAQLGYATPTGNVIGTFNYISPDQLSSEPVSSESDIYSIGIITYEMLTGILPFNPERLDEVLKSRINGVQVMPSALRPALPRAVDTVLLKALAFRREDRYDNARDFAAALLKALSTPAQPDSRITDQPLIAETVPALQSSSSHTIAHSETVLRPAPTTPTLNVQGSFRPLELRTVVGSPPPSPAKSSNWWIWVVIAAVLLAGSGAGLLWYISRNLGTTASDPSPSAPGPARTLNYSLRVQKMRDGKPYKDPFTSSGQEVFENDYKFQMQATSNDPGFLYLFNEGKNDKGDLVYNILYPTPQQKNGSAAVLAGSPIETPWNTFGGKTGTEHVWLIWAKENQSQLEAARAAAFKNSGVVKDAAAVDGLKTFLNNQSGNRPTATKDTDAQRTIINGNGDIVAYPLQLEHR